MAESGKRATAPKAMGAAVSENLTPENCAVEESVIASRKDDHISIALHPRLASRRLATGLEDVQFRHDALPELDLDQIDLSTSFLGRSLKAPLLISSLTGGTDRAARINAHLAEAASELGIAMAVGSQRIALEGRGQGGLDGTLRRLAPNVPLLANIGGAQLAVGYGIDEARRAVEMIEADALIVHLNPLQEAVQPEGDRNWKGVLSGIARIVDEMSCTVVVKEVGTGISAKVARKLVEVGVSVLDVAGAGGTSWAAIEAERVTDPDDRETALLFADWGIPTAQALAQVRAACPDVTLIGSGGIRSGLDAARALRLGADLVGQGAPAVAGAEQGTDVVLRHFRKVIRQLGITCFLTGSADLAALRQAPLLAPQEF